VVVHHHDTHLVEDFDQSAAPLDVWLRSSIEYYVERGQEDDNLHLVERIHVHEGWDGDEDDATDQEDGVVG
jgi:hypothetical protein